MVRRLFSSEGVVVIAGNDGDLKAKRKRLLRSPYNDFVAENGAVTWFSRALRNANHLLRKEVREGEARSWKKHSQD
jgi:hypothetical protein